DTQAFDVPEEQQGSGLDPVQGGGDLRSGDRRRDSVMVEREDEKSPGRGLIHRIRIIRPDVILDPEMLARTVDARGLGVRVHRFETDAELADLREISGLPPLADPADATDVGFSEGPAIVVHLQAIFKKLEGQLGRAGVLSVLDQLEDEVGALAVELPEQVEHGRVPAVPRDVLLADPLIVGWHCLSSQLWPAPSAESTGRPTPACPPRLPPPQEQRGEPRGSPRSKILV